jgi:hypothetical protein
LLVKGYFASKSRDWRCNWEIDSIYTIPKNSKVFKIFKIFKKTALGESFQRKGRDGVIMR